MQIKASESDVLALIKKGDLALNASIQVDGFRKCVASQLPAVKVWIESELRSFTRLTRENFLLATQTLWYLRRDGEVYGPLSHQAILRLNSTLLADDEVIAFDERIYFQALDLQTNPVRDGEAAAQPNVKAA